ncbi:MAG: isopentenyl phosphate kinase family protein [Deltaproteobacteria bacterium]|nr:isopentenyl phosphate kinase family protein [Deltaproteobacteria bacterium]
MAQPIIDAVIKLGGSVVTDKGSDRLTVRRDVVRRLAEEIGASHLERLVLVHGAGSFGHRIVKRTGIDRGVEMPGALAAWAETQRLQYVLAAEVAEICIGAGIPAIVCQASASARLRRGRLESMEVEVVRAILQQGGVPQLYGVPAVDAEQGCAILSGDQIAPFLAQRLGIGLVIHGTDVDGVFESDPALGPTARVPRIGRGNAAAVLAALGGSAHVDVTGGMRGKVESLLQWAQHGVCARIVDATRPGRLAQALAGEEVGTLVRWEEQP